MTTANWRVRVAALVVAAAAAGTPVAAQTPTETVNTAVAAAVPDPQVGWLPADLVKHPLNPVHAAGIDHTDQDHADRIFPTVLRVDDKLAQPLDGHRWYLWLWRHGLSPRTPNNGGRLVLLTSNSLEGPWTDRGFVTPPTMSPPGWNPYGWTGGDIVWSERHRKFFSVPHAARNPAAPHPSYPPPGLDSFLMESADGVNWQLSSPLPVLPAGPETYDKQQTGYGKLLRLDGPGGAEQWLWLYRSHARPGDQTVTYSIATAGDIYGPWEKAPYNPVLNPLDRDADPGAGLLGLGAFDCYQGYYQVMWMDFLGLWRLSRSTDLRNWETFAAYQAGGVRLLDNNDGAPVFGGTAPHEAVITGGDLVFDPDVGALTFVYTAWDAQNYASAVSTAPAGLATVNIARSLSGGAALGEPRSDNPAVLEGACA